MSSIKNLKSILERTGFLLALALIIEVIILVVARGFYSSKNFISALELSITVVTVIIGLYSTIMPIIYGFKDKNKNMKTILEDERYIRYFKSNVNMGILLLLTSFLLIFNDIMCDILKSILSHVWLFMIILFTLYTYRFVFLTTEILILGIDDDGKEMNNNNDAKYKQIDDRYRKDWVK